MSALPILENVGAILWHGCESRGPERLSLRVLEIREHNELRGDTPLVAVIAGTYHKACLVANLILNDGPQAPDDRFRIPLANVYGTMVFYYDYIEAINEAIRQARACIEQLSACSAQAVLQEIKAPLPQACTGPMPTRVSVLISTLT